MDLMIGSMNKIIMVQEMVMDLVMVQEMVQEMD